jgi:transposase
MTHHRRCLVSISRREVEAALRREPRERIRRRLVAIRAILQGKSKRQAYEAANATRGSLDRWLKQLREGGLQALVLERRAGRHATPSVEKPPRLPKVNADPKTLRELAARERNPRIRKRMLALACVAEGTSPLTVAVKMKVAHSVVLERVRRFQEEGLAGLQDRPPFGRPRKLTATQLDELRLVVIDHPEMTYAQLRDFVRSRFRVRYSTKGLQRLLKQDLAIGWRGRPFRRGWTKTTARPSKKIGRHRKSARR